jgi:AcrR family transcriptional regulator
MVETRRERHRRELVDEIRDEARRQLEAGGAASVSWRGIARSVGMSPAALYTYFDGLHALFTDLILESYGSLGAAVRRAVDAFADAPVGDRLLVGPLAYRRWALTHRGEFNLIFTDQLPGYAAEPGGPTIDAQVAVFTPMADVMAEAVGRRARRDPRQSSADDIERFLGLWGTFHGLVSLEVNHHLDWTDAPRLYQRRVRWAIEALGLPPAGTGVVKRFEQWAATLAA